MMRKLKSLALAAGFFLACFPLRSEADAIVTNASMKAPTIAEVFVEKERIRIELEIGIVDFEAFRNVLPDEVLVKMGKREEPLSERFDRFFQEDLVLKADGRILVPALKLIEGRERNRRDEITGEVLPSGRGDPEAVLLVELEYPLGSDLPESLSLKPPGSSGESGNAMATVGFVLYHEGLAVNDFRYLSLESTVDLDWEDPWYSKFRHPNLKRQFDAPLRGFLYAEPFEVRKEIIARPRDLEKWIDLGLEGKETISASEQEEILKRVGEFLGGRCPVTIDGKPATGTLDRIHFVRRSLRQTTVINEDEDLPLVSATIGAIFVCPISGLPQKAAMTWDLFTERTPMMKGVATDEAGGLPITVTPDDPLLVWNNYLKDPTVPSLVEVPAPPAPARWPIPVTGVVALALAVFVRTGKAGNRKLAIGAIALFGILALVPATWIRIPSPFGGSRAQEPGESDTVVQGLLQNIYRAFDFRGESEVYDALDRSVSGDLLTDVYLEVQRALRLENQGGARTKVKEVEVVSAESTPAEAVAGFARKVQWTVLGSVGHWGHVHQRRNRYDAEITIEPVDGVWKLTGLQLLGEERL